MNSLWLHERGDNDLDARRGRGRPVGITGAGRAKRAEAQRHGCVSQEALNQRLGNTRVLALHVLINNAWALLAPPTDETGSA